MTEQEREEKQAQFLNSVSDSIKACEIFNVLGTEQFSIAAWLHDGKVTLRLSRVFKSTP